MSVLHSKKYWVLFQKQAAENTQALLKVPAFLCYFQAPERENGLWLSCSEESVEKEKPLVFSPWKCLHFQISWRRGGWADAGVLNIYLE